MNPDVNIEINVELNVKLKQLFKVFNDLSEQLQLKKNIQTLSIRELRET